ncbi:nuclear transport factor 2 family protein [Ekhidna sp.]|uniref:nuclear transport factor 2 family protein n=1 Tax=Ekhidna sp. TaxID=2608089 RepID=UPI003BACEDEE
MKKLIVVLFCCFYLTSFSQENDKNDIMQVINNVFEAMRTSDSTLLKSSFVEEPNTFTAFINQEGKSTLVNGDFQRFINAVGQPKDQVWNEPIWNEKVEVDGNLASVWVDYAFYVDDQFSHCGVDAFHLIKREDGWKIFHLVDTRRKSDCVIPDEIKP